MTYDEFYALCKEKGLRPSDVSRETGISSATLSCWKRGEYTPKADKMEKLERFMGYIAEKPIPKQNVDILTEVYNNLNSEKKAKLMEYVVRLMLDSNDM